MRKLLLLSLLACALPVSAQQSSDRSFQDSLAQGSQAILGGAALLRAPRAVPRAVSRAVHEPRALSRLLDTVEAVARSGQKPVVLFDLDDTLLDTAARHARILRESAADPSVLQAYPAEAAKIASADKSRMRYNVKDDLAAYGVADPDFIYLLEDEANPGAVDFVKAIVAKGGIAVYFTGRWEEMRPGTEGGLAKNGFPAPDGKSVLLWMKPTRTA